MAQTAKIILLTDENGINISPITNLESIYYETKDSNNVIFRNYIYSGFPVYTNISTNCENICVNATTIEPLNIASNSTIKYKNNDNILDILVSCINMHRLEGTAYKKIDVSNYNLSSILYNYVSKYQFDASLKVLQEEINDLSSYVKEHIEEKLTIPVQIDNIKDEELRFENKFKNLYIYEYLQLLSMIADSSLYPSILYELEYYYTDNNIQSEDNIFNLILIADTSVSFSKKVVGCTIGKDYNNNLSNNDPRQWIAEYDFDTNTITYLKDANNNIANFDFINYPTFCNMNTDDRKKEYIDIFGNTILSKGTKIYGGLNIKNNYIGLNCNNIIISNNSGSVSSINNNFIDCSNNNIEIYGNNNLISICNSSIYIYGKNNIIDKDCIDISIHSNNIILQNNKFIKCTDNNFIGSNNENVSINVKNIIGNSNSYIYLHDNNLIGNNNNRINVNNYNSNNNDIIIGNNNASINTNLQDKIVILNDNNDIIINNTNVYIGNLNTTIVCNSSNVNIGNNNENLTITTANNTVIENNCINCSSNKNTYILNNNENINAGENNIIYLNNNGENILQNIPNNCIIAPNTLLYYNNELLDNSTFYTNHIFYANEYIEEN